MTSDSDFDVDNGQGGLGDPIDYNFTNYVNWLGLFAQAEYILDKISAFAMGGLLQLSTHIGTTFMMALIQINTHLLTFQQKMHLMQTGLKV